MTYRVCVSCVDAWNTITMTNNAVRIFASVRVCMDVSASDIVEKEQNKYTIQEMLLVTFIQRVP